MPVPIPGPKVGSDSQKVKFLPIFGRPKTGFFDQISGVRGTFPQFPLATNHAEKAKLLPLVPLWTPGALKWPASIGFRRPFWIEKLLHKRMSYERNIDNQAFGTARVNDGYGFSATSVPAADLCFLASVRWLTFPLAAQCHLQVPR